MGLALVVPFTIAVVNVVDKVILERHVPSIYIFALWAGLITLLIGGLLTLGLNLHQLETRALWGGVLTGVTRAGSFFAFMAALRQGQLARVTPVYYLYPLMVAPMAAGFLGEELTTVAWAAIVLAVVGAGLVSRQGAGVGRLWSQPQAQALALLAGLLFAVGNVMSKHFLDEEPFWHFYGSSRLGFSLGTLTVLGMKDVRQRGFAMIRNIKFIRLWALDELLVTGAVIASLEALNRGPVSLISAVGALQPSVVLFYSLALARISPATFGSWISTASLPTQIIGTCAITAAVVLISLF